MPDRRPEHLSDRITECISDRVLDNIPERLTEHMWGSMSENILERMTEHMSDRMPGRFQSVRQIDCQTRYPNRCQIQWVVKWQHICPNMHLEMSQWGSLKKICVFSLWDWTFLTSPAGWLDWKRLGWLGQLHSFAFACLREWTRGAGPSRIILGSGRIYSGRKRGELQATSPDRT